jgi:hypothetical protein
VSWQAGLLLWLIGGMAAMWVWGEIIERFSRPTDDWDRVADRKRRTERKAKQISREYQ